MTETMGQARSATTRGIVEEYLAVWNEADPAARRGAVARLWAPDGVEYLEGGIKYRGHEELTDRVTRAYEAFVASGQYDVTPADDVTEHGDIITLTVQLTTPAGVVDWAARVFLLIGPDGLIREDYHLTVKPLPPA
ncbi:MAG TPA: nuclear transport factor 2 family protein [Trebonia sp.]|nr:nuclear transport factor 2 family protein [Trebonia sp.]